MELKLGSRTSSTRDKRSLNRTFYGIETSVNNGEWSLFYCLNRTFYGIETLCMLQVSVSGRVLIVPFMELKQCAAMADGCAVLS